MVCLSSRSEKSEKVAGRAPSYNKPMQNCQVVLDSYVNKLQLVLMESPEGSSSSSSSSSCCSSISSNSNSSSSISSNISIIISSYSRSRIASASLFSTMI